MAFGALKNPMITCFDSAPFSISQSALEAFGKEGRIDTDLKGMQRCVGFTFGFLFNPNEGNIPWVVPLPRIPVTTRIILFLVGDLNLNLHLPLLLGGGTTQDIPLAILLFWLFFGEYIIRWPRNFKVLFFHDLTETVREVYVSRSFQLESPNTGF